MSATGKSDHDARPASRLRFATPTVSQKTDIHHPAIQSNAAIRRARLNPASLNAQEVLQLQRLVGNRAVSQLLRETRPHPSNQAPQNDRVQRVYLDQDDKVGAWTTSTKELTGQDQSAATYIARKLVEYQKATTSRIIDPLVVIEAANALGTAAIEGKGFPLLKNAAAILLAELMPIIDDLATAIDLRQKMRAEGFRTNLDQVSNAYLDIGERLLKYGKQQAKSPHPGVWFILSEAKYELARQQSVLRQGLKEDEFDFGTLVEGKTVITEETKNWLKDFKAIEDFLKNKQLVLECLVPLARHVKENVKENDWLAALKEGLRQAELKAGFQKEVYAPLGLLPAKDFFALMTEGHMLDDYGAGQQHGELTHRFQWYAIITAYNERKLTLHKPPVEVYKTMNTGIFAFPRGGNSIWGRLLDKEVKVSEDTYSYPGTLNRDLQETTEHFNPGGVGLATSKEGTGVTRPAEYHAPNVKGLESIGQALAQLKELRTIEAKKTASNEELESNDWRLFGVPPASSAARYEEYLKSVGYAEHSSGMRSGTPWKVLKSPSSKH